MSRVLNKPVHRLICALALVLAVMAGGLAVQSPTVTAQGAPLLMDQATLRLWPEYDDPGLLVILSGVFTGTTTFPLPVAFPVPPGARGIQATYVDQNGDLYNQPWQIVDGQLRYELPRAEFQIEFYLDRPPAGNQRELNYTFEVPYAINSLLVSLQQPARATAFTATPQPEQVFQGNDGFMYHTFVRTALKPGDRLPITLRYTKTDQGLSVAQAKLEPAPAPASSANTAASSTEQWLPYLLFALAGAMLIAAAVYWLVRVRPAASAAAPATGRRTAARPVREPAGKSAFCTQCGHRFSPGDRFCAKCGAPRRNENS